MPSLPTPSPSRPPSPRDREATAALLVGAGLFSSLGLLAGFGVPLRVSGPGAGLVVVGVRVVLLGVVLAAFATGVGASLVRRRTGRRAWPTASRTAFFALALFMAYFASDYLS